MVHQYKNNGYNIVIDVNSGSIHSVDDLTYDLLPIVEEYIENHKIAQGGQYDINEITDVILKKIAADREEIYEIVSELLELRDNGSLFADDIYENYLVDFKKRKTVVKALCLHIAHDCNLGCKYCFAEEGEYHGRRALMSLEVGKKALDFLVASSGSRRNLEVDFFGGEPLMNWNVVKELVEYGRSLEEPNNKKFRFTLTTNGTLLNDEILEFANREMANIVLSIDGRKEINDLMRPFRGGKKTSAYDIIVPKYKKVAESRNQTNYYVRGTYTRNNLDFSRDVLHLADLGFKQISVEPVVAKPEDDYSIKDEDIDTLKNEYDILAKEMLKRKKEGRAFNFFHFMIDLEGGPCVAKRLSGCGRHGIPRRHALGGFVSLPSVRGKRGFPSGKCGRRNSKDRDL